MKNEPAINPKIIIIRGPSGAGKTSIAKALKDRSDRPTFLIEQDIFRPLFNKWGSDFQIPIWELMEACVKVGLENNHDVILEGILNVQKPGRMDFFERLFKTHPNENYIFYVDTSFSETLKRHNTRLEWKNRFGKKEMKEWWPLASRLGHMDEIVISESSTLEESIQLVAKTTGLNLNEPA